MNLYPAARVLFKGQLTCCQRNLRSYRVWLNLLYGDFLLSFYLRSFLVIIVFNFLVCSEDADSLRIHTLSATGDIESIQKMVDDLDIEQGPSSSS